MKKLLIPLISICLCSCTKNISLKSSTGNHIYQGDLSSLNSNNIVIGETITNEKEFKKVGVLFFLFGTNGGGESGRREKLYVQTCKDLKIDGILQPKFETKRTILPFIAINGIFWKTTVSGKGYTIKSEAKR